MLSLADAAHRIGLHRSNLLRAIKAGRISGRRDEGGNWRIDESELVRVYGDLRSATLQPAPADALMELKLEHAEQRIGDLTRQLERALCDAADWKDQAKRLALPPPSAPRQPAPPDAAATPEPTTAWGRFLRWRRAG